MDGLRLFLDLCTKAVENCLFCWSLNWAPDGKWILFEASFAVGNTLQIYTANVDTLELQRVTTGSKTKFQASLSPDGTRVVYVEEGETTDLVVINMVSGESRKITYTRGFESNPSWSPDGTRLAFLYSDTRHTDGYELRLANASGDIQDTFADLPIGYGRLSWSPDGKEILFVSNSSCPRLEKINLETKIRIQYSEIPGCVIDSSWSWDKNLILFIAGQDVTEVTGRLEPGTWQIYTMTPSGNDILKITDFDNWVPISAVFEPIK